MENMINTTTPEITTAPAVEAQVAVPVTAPTPDMNNYMLKSEAQKRTKRGAIVGGAIGLGLGIGGSILGTKLGKAIANHNAKKNQPAPAPQPDAPTPAPQQIPPIQITAEQLAQLNAMNQAQANPEPAPAPADNKKK